MSTEGQVDWGRMDEVMKPVKRVLSYDLERLRRTDEAKRISFWKDIESKMNTFGEELGLSLPSDLSHHYLSEFVLAKLLLGAASFLNGERSETASAFNNQELLLVQDFERLNTFDILSTDDICERIARRDELLSLVSETYEKQYSDLDRALDSPEVQRDLKLAFKKRYQKRLDHIKEGVKAYVDKYGPIIMVRQIENHIWGHIKESQREREEISAEVKRRLEGLSSRLGSLGGIENETETLKRKLSEFGKAVIEGTNPDPSFIQAEKERLLKTLSDFEDEFINHIGVIGEERKRLEEREAELQRMTEDYRRQAEEEKQRIVESELNEIEKTRSELAAREQSLEEERNSLGIKRQELDERLRQLEEVVQGKGVRYTPGEEARLAELNFIARFEEKMHHFPVKIFSPMENKAFTVNSWGKGSHLRTSEMQTDIAIPSNESSRYIIAEKRFKLFGEDMPKVVVEAVSFGHLEEFNEHGFDTRSANLGELLGIISSRINNAELGNYLHVMGIASPTGWDEKVVNEISSDTFAKNYVSRNVSVCLVDSITGEVFYNLQDEGIAGFIDHFKPEFDRERLQRSKDLLREELRARGVVGYNDFLKETEEDRGILLKAFYELEKEGKGKTRYIKGIGLVLDVVDLK